MIANLQKFFSLELQQQALFILASAYLISFRLGLRLFNLSRFYHFLSRWKLGPDTQSNAQKLMQATKMAQIIHQAGNHISSANCLPQSLLLWWWLRRQGVPTELRIGVDKQAAHFAAHAWVEYDGIALAESEDVGQHFAAFDNLTNAMESLQS